MALQRLWPFRDSDDVKVAPAPGVGTPSPAFILPGRWSQLPPPLRLFLVMMALLFGWYGVVGTILAGVDVDVGLRPEPELLPPGGSVTAGMAAALLRDQVQDRAFTPNDPIFYPTGLARRTPAFQSHLVTTTSSAISELARNSGSAELTLAATSLAVPPDSWWLRAGWPPVGLPAERHYGRAIEQLAAHNRVRAQALQPGEQARRVMDPGSRAALAALLTAVETAAAHGDAVIRGTSETSPAVQFASSRGTAYAAALLMRGLRDDNAAAIRSSGRAARWGEALDALDAAAELDPMFVRQGDLVTSGYSLLMAGNAMRAILDGPTAEAL